MQIENALLTQRIESAKQTRSRSCDRYQSDPRVAGGRGQPVVHEVHGRAGGDVPAGAVPVRVARPVRGRALPLTSA